MSLVGRRMLRASRKNKPVTVTGIVCRIACGQTNSVNGGDLPLWQADFAYDNGTPASTTANIDMSGVTNPAPMSIYQHERWADGTITYTITGLTASAAYGVRLHFAESYYTAIGERVMNISVNGVTKVTGYDIIAASGSINKAALVQVSAAADMSGKLAIMFSATSSGNDPKIDGIEITGNVTKDDTPLNLSGQPGATYVSLSWSAPAFSTGTITGYNIYQNGIKLNAAPVTGVAYRPGQDSSALVPSTAYTFKVASVVNGIETKSATIAVTTGTTQVAGPLQTTASFTGSRGQTINYGVRFPNDYYSSGKLYPVYFSLHGRDDDYAGFLDTAVASIRPSIDTGILSEGIIVTPDSFSTGRWEDGSLGPAETNLLELIPYIETHYNVKPGAAWRLLTGFSMGGHGAFLHGVKHCDLFAGIWSVDGAMSYSSSDYTQFAAGKTTADFHIRTIGGNLNGSRVQTVIDDFASNGITIPYVFYAVDHDFTLLAAADRDAGSPDIRFLQARLGIAP